MRVSAKALFAIVCAVLAITADASRAQAPAGADRISARMVANEIRLMGLPANVGKLDPTTPLVTTQVDGANWIVFFYGCEKSGDLEQRLCDNIEFHSSYVVSKAVPASVMNRWNMENRFARGYSLVDKDRRANARMEVDVLFAGTGADPARLFRGYFLLMRQLSFEFRKRIGFN
jgi:hypothetical protein